MSPTARQFELIRLLRTPHSLRALSQRFGVSKNTVQRDLDKLGSAGVCVAEERDGQMLLYRVEGAGPVTAGAIDPRMIAPVLAALKPWRRTAWARQVLATLPQVDARLFDSTEPEPLVSGGAQMLGELARGLLGQHQVRISYRSRERAIRHRYTIEPMRLRLAGGLQYLDARTVPDGATRTFAVHRLIDARALKTRFVPVPLPRTAFGAFEGPPVDVEVKFDAPVAEFIAERRWHPSQRLELLADGGVVWRARVSGSHEFIGWVMSWAPWAELISPLEWRKQLHQRAHALVSRHGI